MGTKGGERRAMPSLRALRRETALWWLAAVAAIFLLRAAQPLLLPVTIAFILTILLSRPVRYLRQHGVNDAIGAALVIVVLAAILFLLAVILTRPAAEWLDQAPANIAALSESLEHLKNSVPLLRSVGNGAPAANGAESLTTHLAGTAITLAQAALYRAGDVAIMVGAVIFLLYFFLISERWFVPYVVQSIRERRRRMAFVVMLQDVRDDLGRYLAVMAFMNAMLGVSTGIAMFAIGLPNPIFWGALAGTLNFLPYIGPAVMYILLALASVLHFDSLGLMFLPCAIYGVLSVTESSIISPSLVSYRVRISKVVVFLSVMLWGWLWGIGGTIVGVPLLIFMRIALRRRIDAHHGLMRALLDPDGRPPPTMHTAIRDGNGEDDAGCAAAESPKDISLTSAPNRMRSKSGR